MLRPDRASNPDPPPDPPLGDLVRELIDRIEGLTARLDRAASPDRSQVPGRETEVAGTEYVSVKQAARFASLSESSIRRAIVGGSLPAANKGTEKRPLWRIARTDLIAWMELAKGGSLKLPPRTELKDLIRRHLPGL